MRFEPKRIAALSICIAVGATTGAQAAESTATAVADGTAKAAKRVTVKCHKVRKGPNKRFKCSIPKSSLPAGPRGPAGPNGPIGATGATGAAGAAGATGATGSPGTTGTTGAVGATGATGNTGATGSTGATGDTGPTGNIGPTGDTGPTGPAVALATAADSASAASADFTGTPATVLGTTISPTASNKLLIASSVSVDATALGNTGVRCRIYIDGVAFGPGADTVVAPLLSPGEATVSLNFLSGSLAAGPRSVEVRCSQEDGGGSAAAVGRSLTVLALAG